MCNFFRDTLYMYTLVQWLPQNLVISLGSCRLLRTPPSRPCWSPTTTTFVRWMEDDDGFSPVTRRGDGSSRGRSCDFWRPAPMLLRPSLQIIHIVINFWLSVGSPISPDVRPGRGWRAKILRSILSLVIKTKLRNVNRMSERQKHRPTDRQTDRQKDR